MTRWAEGDVDTLLHEGQTIQSQIPQNEQKKEDSNLIRSFERLVSRGNVRAATRLITEEGDKGSLPVNYIDPA